MMKSHIEICPDCHGQGEVEVGFYKYASFNRDIGEEYATWQMCDLCSGSGVVEEALRDLD
jgi:DnaJ-class molecular chaperone